MVVPAAVIKQSAKVHGPLIMLISNINRLMDLLYLTYVGGLATHKYGRMHYVRLGSSSICNIMCVSSAFCPVFRSHPKQSFIWYIVQYK